MSDNNNNQNGSSKKRKADGTGPSPKGKKLTADLLSTLEDPDLCDVTLIGSDGGRVPAIRLYLSARSDVLKQLLVGQFREANEEEVHMDYPSPVLKALVHYCCTDEVPELDTLGPELYERIDSAAKLCAAADYYGLDSLKEKAFEAIMDSIRVTKEDERGACICLLFESLSQFPALRKSKLYGAAYAEIWHRPSLSLLVGSRPGVTCLSALNLTMLSFDKRFLGFAWLIFRAIKVWLTHDEENASQEVKEERLQAAKMCASNLELSMISPTDLVGPVRESGLIDESQIIQTLQVQSKGGFIGLCGAGIPGVNGIYEEIPHINEDFVAVDEGDQSRCPDIKRFDKRGLLNGTEVTFSVLSFRDENDRQVWSILAPPEGAGSILVGGDGKVIQNNRGLYQSATRMKSDGMKFRVPDDSDKISQGTRAPRMISGYALSSVPSHLLPDDGSLMGT